jgi:hypothetical protein
VLLSAGVAPERVWPEGWGVTERTTAHEAFTLEVRMETIA